MSEDAEWGPWLEHDGVDIPVKVGTIVRGLFRDGSMDVWAAGTRPYIFNGWYWMAYSLPQPKDILRYQIRKPQALLDLIKLVETLPKEVKVDDLIKEDV